MCTALKLILGLSTNSLWFYTADSVAVVGTNQAVPYVTLLDSFEEYTQDSWTYDGRLVYSVARIFSSF